jgi:hypothetical protein
MKPEEIIEHIDEWLDEHSWRLGDPDLDFALDVRRLVNQLERDEERTPAGV